MIELASISASELHQSLVGDPAAVASAPGSWNLIGEATSGLGGVTITGNAHLRAQVAYSPRTDSTIAVHWCDQVPSPSLTHTEISTQEIAQTAALSDPENSDVQPPQINNVTPAHRLGAIAWNLEYSQSVRGMSHGIDVTVVNSIPRHVGLGDMTAVESALALALSADVPEIDTPPERLRLSEACTRAGSIFLETPPVASRYAVNLRADKTNPCMYDARESTLFEVPRIAGTDYRVCVVAKPDAAASSHVQELRNDIVSLVQEASRAFQADTLRDLPDAAERILQWLDAHHALGRGEGLPPVKKAQIWLNFYFSELKRTTTLSSTIRARHMAETAQILNQSQHDLLSIFQPGDDVRALTELVRARGALSARCSTEDLRASVLAIVPDKRWNTFRSQFLEDGLQLVEICPGAAARLGTE